MGRAVRRGPLELGVRKNAPVFYFVGRMPIVRGQRDDYYFYLPLVSYFDGICLSGRDHAWHPSILWLVPASGDRGTGKRTRGIFAGNGDAKPRLGTGLACGWRAGRQIWRGQSGHDWRDFLRWRPVADGGGDYAGRVVIWPDYDRYWAGQCRDFYRAGGGCQSHLT